MFSDVKRKRESPECGETHFYHKCVVSIPNGLPECTDCVHPELLSHAVSYCPSCEEYLCEYCTSKHKIRKTKKSHVAFRLGDGKAQPTVRND